MKRCYVCAMLMLICILAFPGYISAQGNPKANVSGRVWLDDGDGIQQPTETTGIKDVTVYVRKISDDSQVVDPVLTKNDGTYEFKNLDVNIAYYVQFTLPPGYTFSPWQQGTDQALDSDANPDEDGKTMQFILKDNEDQVFDAGMKQTVTYGSISGHIWDDTNKDGIRDGGESGIVGQDVTLKMPGKTDITVQTGAEGYYIFENVPAGTNYNIQFTLKTDYDYSPKDNSSTTEEFDSDAKNNGQTDNFDIIAGQNKTFVDAGMYAKEFFGTISGYVWNDLDNDGIRESGESGIVDQNVTLKKSGKTDITIKTGAEGYYLFENVPVGTNYHIQFSLPTDYEYSGTKDNSSTTEELDSDADPTTGLTDAIDVAKDENKTFVNAGMHIKQFFGTVSGYVWDDSKNKNGIKENGESGIEGLDVILKIPGQPDLSTKTVTGGYYEFTNVPVGTNYKVKFNLKENYQFTLQNVGDDGTDSDADPTEGSNEGFTAEFNLEKNNSVSFYAGMFLPDAPDDNPNPQINGILWNDANGDGFQGGVATEPGIGGWTVKLLGADKTTVLATTTTSNSSDPGQTGRYSFTHLTAGTYYIQFVNPGGYTFTLQNAVNDNRDSDVNSQGLSDAVVITDNAREEHVDAGVYGGTEPPGGNAKISGRLWNDTFDKDGLQGGVSNEPGIGGQLVELYLSDGTLYKSTTTESSGGAGVIGTYKFENVAIGSYYVKFYLPSGFTFTIKDADNNDQKDSDADQTTGQTDNFTVTNNAEITHIDAGAIKGDTQKGSIGDLVWNDKNCNGIQDSGEDGVPGVTVILYSYDNGTTTYMTEQTTGPAGLYSFTNLEAGSYRVKFVLPASFEKFTAKDAGGDDTKDSDAGLDGWADPITLSEGENNMDIDAGLCKKPAEKCSIGDLVWFDKDCDGIQDLTEKGVGYVEVRLYAYDNGHSTFMKKTLTDQYGGYIFTNLEAGHYRVRFILPDSYEKFTIKDAEENLYDDKDSDADHDGWTDPITLYEGENDDDVDAGLCKTVCENASIGDLVWNDCNRNGIQDAGETGIECVEVKLHLCTSDHANHNDPCGCGDLIATTKTDKTGRYLFTHLKPGYYCVEIVVPCNYTITKPDQTDDWKDSDVIPSTKHTACIKLNCEANMTVDAGLYPTPPATIGDLVWIDANKNGIQDNGEKGLCNVNVELYMCGVTKPVAATKTDNNGNYIFKNVVSGTSYAVKFYMPKGYTFTALDQGKDDKFDSDVCPNSGITKFYDVLPDETNMTIDCGMYLATTTACNYVWKDNNNNGVKDESEPGIQGVTVELYQCSNNTLVQSVKTDASGLFTFKDIPVETYYLQIIIPDGFKIGNAVQNGGSQDVNAEIGINGQSTCFDITEGTTSIGKPIALVLSTTGITRGSEIPTEFSLQQNYPNPFNPSTTIEFAVPSAGQYTLKVFNMLGQEVATLLDRELPVGYHMVTFDASRMPSGMYIYRLSGSNVLMTKKMMLSK